MYRYNDTIKHRMRSLTKLIVYSNYGWRTESNVKILGTVNHFYSDRNRHEVSFWGRDLIAISFFGNINVIIILTYLSIKLKLKGQRNRTRKLRKHQRTYY